MTHVSPEITSRHRSPRVPSAASGASVALDLPTCPANMDTEATIRRLGSPQRGRASSVDLPVSFRGGSSSNRARERASKTVAMASSSPPASPQERHATGCRMVEMELGAARALAHLAGLAGGGDGDGSRSRERSTSESPVRAQQKSFHGGRESSALGVRKRTLLVSLAHIRCLS